MLDEPNDPDAYERVRQLGAMVKEGAPQLRRLVVEQPYVQKPEWGTLRRRHRYLVPPCLASCTNPSVQRVMVQGDDVWSYTALVQTAPPVSPRLRNRSRRYTALLGDRFPPLPPTASHHGSTGATKSPIALLADRLLGQPPNVTPGTILDSAFDGMAKVPFSIPATKPVSKDRSPRFGSRISATAWRITSISPFSMLGDSAIPSTGLCAGRRPYMGNLEPGLLPSPRTPSPIGRGHSQNRADAEVIRSEKEKGAIPLGHGALSENKTWDSVAGRIWCRDEHHQRRFPSARRPCLC